MEVASLGERYHGNSKQVLGLGQVLFFPSFLFVNQ